MHQSKMVKLMILISYLSGVNIYKAVELARKLHVDRSTIYNYYDSLELGGFILDHDTSKRYFIKEYPSGLEFMGKYVNLEEEELDYIIECISGSPQSATMKRHLIEKLNAHKKREHDRFRNFHEEIPQNMDALRRAMQEKRTVVLMDYASNSSGKTADKTVEPFCFLEGMEHIYAYDVKKRENRVYRISRIGEVKVLDKRWEYESFHHKRKGDCFHMTGHDEIHIVLEMGTMAKNLLLEEFPSAEYDVIDLGDDRWRLDTQIEGIEGIGRFFLGVAKDVKIIEGEELKRYVGRYTRNNLIKFTKYA